MNGPVKEIAAYMDRAEGWNSVTGIWKTADML